MTKTKLINFTFKKSVQNTIDLTIGNNKLNNVKQHSFQGLVIDSHVGGRNISMKLYQSFKGNELKHFTKLLDVNTLRIIYYGFIYPYLANGIEVWGGVLDKYLSQLICIMK